MAALAAGITLIPFGIGLYFLFKYVPGVYIDYTIAGIIFLLGVNEVREGLSEKNNRESKEDSDSKERGWKAVWPAYVGTVLEGGEAVLYTFAVAHGSGGWLSAVVGGAIGFFLPWAGLVWLRRWIESLPEWKVELSIGVVLMSAATIFALLRIFGVFGG